MALDSGPVKGDGVIEGNETVLDELGSRALVGQEVDLLSLQLGDTGSEAHLGVVENMASASSGELGKLSALERDVDQNNLRLQGDRSFNLSDGGQANQEMIFDQADMPHPSETNPAIQALYMVMLGAGVSPNQLSETVEANASNGDLDAAAAANLLEDNAALEALYEIAEKFGNSDLNEYMQDAHSFVVAGMAESGIKDLPEVIGTEPEPDAATPDAEFAITAPSNQMEVQLGGLNGPAAPGR